MGNQLEMGSEFIWKNFHLGTELEIAGSFIYDALYTFDQIDIFHYESEVFDFLYKASVGIERLQKITLIMLTNFNGSVDKDFEKSLVTHNSKLLHNRISSIIPIKLNKQGNKLLDLLTLFYKSNRYGRFNFISSTSSKHEMQSFVKYVSELVETEFKFGSFTVLRNEPGIKREIGKVFKSIVLAYYALIKKTCDDLNIYTYEINQQSKAFQIFWAESFDFMDYEHVKREALYFLLKNSNEIDNLNKLKKVNPVSFDITELGYIVKFILSQCKYPHIEDSFRCFFEEDFDGQNLEEIYEERQLALEYLFST